MRWLESEWLLCNENNEKFDVMLSKCLADDEFHEEEEEDFYRR